MAETLLNYLNNEIKLSQKIKSIEIDFKNGYLFAELLSNAECLLSNKLSAFNLNAKTKAEIKINYILLKEDLACLGIHLDDITINELTNNIKGIIPKLLYKIKTQIDRRKIKFDEIMTKLIDYQNEEKKDKLNESKTSFNKTAYNIKSNLNDNNKLPEITYMSTFYGTNSNFKLIKRKTPFPTDMNLNNLKFSENNKFVSDQIINKSKKSKKKLEPLFSKNLNFMPLIPKTNQNEIKTIKNYNFLKTNTNIIYDKSSKLYGIK